MPRSGGMRRLPRATTACWRRWTRAISTCGRSTGIASKDCAPQSRRDQPSRASRASSSSGSVPLPARCGSSSAAPAPAGGIAGCERNGSALRVPVNPRMRILLVGDYPPDPRLGSTKVLLKLREEFEVMGHGCDVLLADGLGGPRNPYLRQAVAPLAARSAVRRQFSQKGPYDVVDVASAEGLWLATGKRGQLNGAAVISRSNGLEHLNYRRMLDDHAAGLIRKPWTRRLFHPAVRLTQVAAAARAADRLLLLNEGDREYAVGRRWKSPAEIDVVSHGVSQRFLTEAPSGAERGGAGILYCGSWTHVKGVTYLVDAFASLVQSRHDVRLTVMGGGVPRDEILGAFPTIVRDRVIVIDRSSEDDVM